MSPVRPRTVMLLLAILGLGGCATTGATMGSDVCPEYRDLRCMTAPECSMDYARGCRVCACSPARSGARDPTLPSAVPPDQRVPR